MDLNLSNDPYESYRIFQARIIDQYNAIVTPEKLCHRRRNNGDRGLSKISEIKCYEAFQI